MRRGRIEGVGDGRMVLGAKEMLVAVAIAILERRRERDTVAEIRSRTIFLHGSPRNKEFKEMEISFSFGLILGLGCQGPSLIEKRKKKTLFLLRNNGKGIIMEHRYCV